MRIARPNLWVIGDQTVKRTTLILVPVYQMALWVIGDQTVKRTTLIVVPVYQMALCAKTVDIRLHICVYIHLICICQDYVEINIAILLCSIKGTTCNDIGIKS